MATFQAAEPNFEEIQEAIRTLRNNKHQVLTVLLLKCSKQEAVILETSSNNLFDMEVCENAKGTEESRRIPNFKKEDKM